MRNFPREVINLAIKRFKPVKKIPIKLQISFLVHSIVYQQGLSDKNIKLLNESDEEFKLMFIKELLENYDKLEKSYLIFKKLVTYVRFSNKTLYFLAKELAQKTNSHISSYINFFELEPYQNYVVACLAAQTDSILLRYFQNYNIEDLSEIVDIFQIYIENFPKKAANYIPLLKNFIFQNDKVYFQNNKVYFQELIALLIELTPDALNFMDNIKIFTDMFYKKSLRKFGFHISFGETENASFTVYQENNLSGFNKFLKDNKDYFTEDDVKLLLVWDNASKFENLMVLLSELIFNKEKLYKNLKEYKSYDIKTQHNIAFYLIFDFDKKLIDKILQLKLSKPTQEKLFYFLGRCANRLGDNFLFDYFEIKESSLTKEFIKKLIILLEKLNQVISLLPYTKTNLQKIIKSILSNSESDFLFCSFESDFSKITLSPSNIDIFIEKFDKVYFYLIWFKFGERIDNLPKKLNKLLESWGDISVLFDMFSRLIGREYEEDRKIFFKVLEVLLNYQEDGFKNYKYFGKYGSLEDKQQSRKQIGFLSEYQKRKWTSDFCDVKIVELNQKVVIEEKNKKITELNNKLDSYFSENILKISQEKVNQIINKISEIKKIDKKFFNQLKNDLEFSERKNKDFAKILVYAISQEILLSIFVGSKKDRLNHLFSILKAGIPHFSDKGFAKILQGYLDLFDSSYKKVDTKRVLVSIITDKSKYLFSYGSLVNSTCLDIKTGYFFGSILSLVVDANLKAQFLFEISQKDFNNSKEYEEFLDLIKKEKYIIYYEKGNYYIKVGDYKVKLLNVVARRILRVGIGENERVLLVPERLYKKASLLAKNHLDSFSKESLNKFSKKLRIGIVKGDEPIKIIGTKASYTYSDRCGTIKKNKDYGKGLSFW